jgi:hypothetical protein
VDLATSFARLQQKCQEVREAWVTRGVCTDAEVAAYWPGGEDNPYPVDTLEAWAHAYFNLGRFGARDERKTQDPWADLTGAAALMSEPSPVVLANGETVHAYPKSFSALHHLARCEERINWALAHKAAIAPPVNEEQAAILDTLDHITDVLQRVQVWIVTHPGPGVPYDWSRWPWQQRLETPTWVDELSATDIVQIGVAHTVVNWLRLRALDMLTEPAERSRVTAGWSTFFASIAAEKGLEPDVLMRDRSLVALMSTSSLAADIYRKHRDAAKAGV